MNKNQVIRWGILGAARIAKERLIPAIQEAKNAQLCAIASRNEEKARDFAHNLGIPRVYGSYEDLLKDPEIDAVYIPLPNHLHAEWTIRAAEAGKHVLCEKPAALNEKEVQAMITACHDHGVVFMEAFAFRCHPQWHRLREILDSGHIGDVRNVQARFSIFVDDKNDIRLSPLMGGGALYDIGSYCVNGIRFIMGDEPVQVRGISQFASDSVVDLSTSAVLKFPGGRIAQFDCSLESVYNQSVEITGTKGIIKIHWPFRHPRLIIQKDGKEESGVFEFQLDEYTEQVEHFGDCILSGQSLWYGPEESLANMKVIDAIYQSTILSKFKK
ncbi:Gfo/Idh/MocA family protein [Aneurinibacillus terranovensis]|uniref:Gfo/Idh/MocA family protein n=1 Tax=Aneurinibacillus terranovensis TaxID=278991 RepID=UPI000425BF7F|nr:Gfo/Idh/MocA family oxidoreductase [Aneurinibacillus terranovensis]